MRKVAAVVAIAVGAAIIGYNPNRWDVVILNLPRGHGIHVRDIVGIAFITVGTTILWRTSNLDS